MLLMLSTSGGLAYDYNAVLRQTLLDEGYYQQGDITIGGKLDINIYLFTSVKLLWTDAYEYAGCGKYHVPVQTDCKTKEPELL